MQQVDPPLDRQRPKDNQPRQEETHFMTLPKTVSTFLPFSDYTRK
jgi:hypothetical protein